MKEVELVLFGEYVLASDNPYPYTCAPLRRGEGLMIFPPFLFHKPHILILNVNCAERPLIINTTFNNGSLGSRIDEERSEMR